MLFEYPTKRLLLKILAPNYADSVLEFQLNDKELFERYEADRCPNFYTIEHQKKMLEYEFRLALKKLHIRFYVFLKEDPTKIIGTVSLYNINSTQKCCEIGYKFSSRVHGNGYAFESLLEVICIAFDELELERIVAHVQETNLASVRLLEKIGFQKEGVCRHHLYVKGQWTDHLQFSLLPCDL